MKTKTSGYIVILAASLMLAGFVFYFFAIAPANQLGQSNKALAATINQSVTTQPTPAVAKVASSVVTAETDNTAEYNKELAGLISNWAKDQPAYGHWGIAVRGLNGTTLEASYQGDTVFQSASIYKLYMIYALSQTVPTSQWSQKTPGDYRSINDCVAAMLERSDNACGTAISNWLGWVKSQAKIEKAGYTHTTLDLSPVSTTANDTLKFMADLYNGVTFKPELRQTMIDDMQKSIFRHGIVAGCPDCTVANKTGNLNGYDNDAAIVTVDDKTFALSIFSKGGNGRQIATITSLIQNYIRSHPTI